MIISETKLTENKKLKIKNYTIHRKDRNLRGGGVLILIKNNIIHSTLNANNSCIENIGIKLNTGTIIIGAYTRPSLRISQQDLDNLFNTGQHVIVVGDLNARHVAWKNRNNNIRGVIVHNYITNNNIQLLTADRPTHYPINNMTPSYIDLILSKNVTNLPTPILLDELSSDHLPLLLDWKIKVAVEGGPMTWTFNNTNWRTYRQILKEKTQINNNITDTQTLENEVTKMTENIQHARDKVGRKIQIKYKEDRLPNDIITLIKFKNKIRKRWQRTHHPNDRQRVRDLQTNIRQRINEHKNTTWNDVLRELSTRDNSLWRLTKRLKNKYNKIPSLDENTNNIIVQTDRHKANLLADSLHQTYTGTPNTSQDQCNITETIRNTVYRRYPIPPQMWSKIIANPQFIKDTIMSLPTKKAPGPDEIPTLLLKNLPRKTIINLMYIINAIIQLQYYPEQWKTSVVVPILKVGKDPKKSVSYRPISLLSILSKVAEKVILNKLEKIVKLDTKYQEQQCGFRSGRSTTHMVCKVLHDAINKINNKQNTVALALDINKAFDSIWINGLLYKMLTQHNIPLFFITLIKSYLTKRQYKVKVGNSYSEIKNTKCGVPQGSVLAPKLFNLYIADIPTYTSTKIGLFADDVLVYAHSYYANVAAAHIRSHLRLLQPWMNKWKLAINASKCEAVVLTRKFTNIHIHEPIKINGTRIPITNKIKYLGIIIDNRIRFHLHVRRILNIAFMAMQNVYALLAPNSQMSQENKLLLYKQIIRPVMLYAAPVWCSASDTQVKKLQTMQNKILRCVLSAGRYTRINELHERTNVPLIQNYIYETGEKFYRHKIQQTELTRDITNIRSQHAPKHKPLYSKLPIFLEDLPNNA